MGDSDDERDYKRRDKFYTERRGYEERDHRFGDPPPRGGPWRDPRPGPPPGYGGGGGGGFRAPNRGYMDGFGRDRFSPERRRHEMSPPPKRMRPGWEEREGFGERY